MAAKKGTRKAKGLKKGKKLEAAKPLSRHTTKTVAAGRFQRFAS